jgi:hypothetical protein
LCKKTITSQLLISAHLGCELTSTAIATGANVSASFGIGLMMTSQMEITVGGAFGDATYTIA